MVRIRATKFKPSLNVASSTIQKTKKTQATLTTVSRSIPNAGSATKKTTTTKKPKSVFFSKKTGVTKVSSTGNFNNGVQTNSQKLAILSQFGGLTTKKITTGTLKLTRKPPSVFIPKTTIPFFLSPNFETAPKSKSSSNTEVFTSPKLPEKKIDSKGEIQKPKAGESNPVQDIINFFFGGGGSSDGATDAPLGDISLDFNPVTIDSSVEGDGTDAPSIDDPFLGGLGGGFSEDDSETKTGSFFSSITKDPVLFAVGAIAVIALLAGLLKKR